MENTRLPRRKSRKTRVVLLGVLGVIAVTLTALAVWKAETLWFIFHADRITLRTAGQAVTDIREGPYRVETDTDGYLSYRALEESMHIGVRYRDDEITAVTVDFNVFAVPLYSVNEAIGGAQTLLGPYMTSPEIEALTFLLAGELMAYISDEQIRYKRALGGYTMRVEGSISDGEVQVAITTDSH